MTWTSGLECREEFGEWAPWMAAEEFGGRDEYGSRAESGSQPSVEKTHVHYFHQDFDDCESNSPGGCSVTTATGSTAAAAAAPGNFYDVVYDEFPVEPTQWENYSPPGQTSWVAPTPNEEPAPADAWKRRRGRPSKRDDRRRPASGENIACCRGVYFDQIRHLWRANWPEESVIIDKVTRKMIDIKRCTRTKGFSAKKYGYQEAQRLAIEHREKMTTPGLVRHLVYQDETNPNARLPGSRRKLKPDNNNKATNEPPEWHNIWGDHNKSNWHPCLNEQETSTNNYTEDNAVDGVTLLYTEDEIVTVPIHP